MLKPKFKQQALEQPAQFREALVGWFSDVGKDYPWRRTCDPYAILVSEVMLQQTQIATVLGRGFYHRFLAAFPDISALAAADDEPLLKAWEGLGYYRRARMLRETARALLAERASVFPEALDELMKLPGVGRYTAGALRSFAFDLPAAVVDGNVARVLARVMNFTAVVDDTAGLKQLWAWAEELADPARPRLYNSALMELGQTICRPGVPACLSCPVAEFCQTCAPESLPVKRLKTQISAVDEHALWLRDPAGRLLLHRESSKRREGLWKLPTRAAADIAMLPLLTEHRYAITRYRVTLRVHAAGVPWANFPLGADESWQDPEQLLALAMPAPFRRVIEQLLPEI
jgi:A/G-specific adenine glycosylase